MVNKRAFVEPRNCVLEKGQNLEQFKLLASAAKSSGKACIVQLGHPGKLAPLPILQTPVGPSAVAADLPLMGFRICKELSVQEINELTQEFVTAANLAVEAGFDGVQLHCAHGYLLSQFLSPISNVRKDEFGGSLQNRARFLMNIVCEIAKTFRESKKILCVKINSSDFQKNGYSIEDCVELMKMLDALGVLDFVEISGGNYENPVMMSNNNRGAYFIEQCTEIKKSKIQIPLMITGGLRDKDAINRILQNGQADLFGIARPYAQFNEIFQGNSDKLTLAPTFGFSKLIDAFLTLAFTNLLMEDIGMKRKPNIHRGRFMVLFMSLFRLIYKSLTQKY